MKQVQRDSKYIIKRILIGVGIALILANLRKCNVYAESINVSSPTIQQNYCFNGVSVEVVECSDSILENNYNPFELRIKETPVGTNIFTFFSNVNSYSSYSFGFENLSNGDMFFMKSSVPTSRVSKYNRFGVSENGLGAFLFIGNTFTDNNYSSGLFTNVYITEDYSRALDLYNSNLIFSNSSAYPRYLSHVNDYYFVGFTATNNFNFNNFFGDFNSPWVMNQLNGDVVFNDYEYNLYLIQTVSTTMQPDSIIYDIPIDDQSNNFIINPQDYWQQGFTLGGDSFLDDSCSNGGLCSNNIESYIDFLKIPFTFINSLSRDNCQKINLPIPFVNGNIEINCLSSIFENVLGSNFYNIIFYLITGLYAYRITIMNIDTITDILNPTDDKLEVIDL